MWVWINVQLEQHPQIQQWKHLDATQTWLKYASPPIWAKVRASQELIQTHQTKLGSFEPLCFSLNPNASWQWKNFV